MLHNDVIDRWDRAHFVHPSTHLAAHARGEGPGRIICGGEGSHVIDRDGNRLLDAFAGLYCVNVGYGRSEIAEAIATQAQQLAYYHAYMGHGTEASVTLARMVAERTPEGLDHVYFGLGGSDANETNIKLVRYYNNVLGRPAKKKIIARWRGYHGSGLVSGSLTGLATFHNHFDLPLPGILHTHAPYYWRRPIQEQTEREFSAWCAQELEALIAREGADTIAAFIAEPMLGTGGIVPPPEGYWEAVAPLLQAHDILLIADEVVTGFGRLGSMFGSPHYGIKPDLMTIAKGLTSAYAPLSGSVISDRLYEVLMAGTDRFGPLGHGWTYSAHPLCAAAGVANLELIDRLGLVENAKEVGSTLLAKLQEAVGDHPFVGEVRGEGMLAAVELAQDPATRRPFDSSRKAAAGVVARMLQEGVIARAMPEGDIIGFAPPLCLGEDEAEQIAAVTARALEELSS